MTNQFIIQWLKQNTTLSSSYLPAELQGLKYYINDPTEEELIQIANEMAKIYKQIPDLERCYRIVRKNGGR